MAPLEGTGRYESQKKTLVADGTPDLPYRTIEIRIFVEFLRRRRIVKFCFETSRCDGQSSAGGGNQVGGQLPVWKIWGAIMETPCRVERRGSSRKSPEFSENLEIFGGS